MLRITVELLPGGNLSRRKRLAKMDIANLSNLADVSDYAVDAEEVGSMGRHARECEATVTGHDRNSSVWALVAKAATAVSE